MIILLFVLFGLGLPVLLGFSIGRWRTDWGRWRITLFAGLPFPALIAQQSLGLLYSGLAGTPSECSVDACAMDVSFGMMGLGLAVLLTGLGIAMALAGLALARRKTPAKLTDTFK